MIGMCSITNLWGHVVPHLVMDMLGVSVYGADDKVGGVSARGASALYQMEPQLFAPWQPRRRSEPR